MEPGLIFSRSGTRQRLYRVDPLLFSQYETINDLFLPCARDLPRHGLKLTWYVFDFGYANPNNSIPPNGRVDSIQLIAGDFLAEIINGAYNAFPPQALQNPAFAPPTIGTFGANVSPGLLVNFYHTHNGIQRQWGNKDMTDVQFLGSGENPSVFKDPALLPQGDTLLCEVANLTNATLQAQIMLLGGEFDAEAVGVDA